MRRVWFLFFSRDQVQFPDSRHPHVQLDSKALVMPRSQKRELRRQERVMAACSLRAPHRHRLPSANSKSRTPASRRHCSGARLDILGAKNDRLADTRLARRLRDLTSENENEMKRKIENLEKEVDLTADLQGASSPALMISQRV